MHENKVHSCPVPCCILQQIELAGRKMLLLPQKSLPSSSSCWHLHNEDTSCSSLVETVCVLAGGRLQFWALQNQISEQNLHSTGIIIHAFCYAYPMNIYWEQCVVVSFAFIQEKLTLALSKTESGRAREEKKYEVCTSQRVVHCWFKRTTF